MNGHRPETATGRSALRARLWQSRLQAHSSGGTMRTGLTFCLRGLLGMALPCLALAQTATISVNLGGDIDSVDDRLFGINSTLWDADLGSQATQTLLNEAGIRAIRLPGGSVSDEYHWRTN